MKVIRNQSGVELVVIPEKGLPKPITNGKYSEATHGTLEAMDENLINYDLIEALLYLISRRYVRRFCGWVE